MKTEFLEGYEKKLFDGRSMKAPSLFMSGICFTSYGHCIASPALEERGGSGFYR